jgi:hypothetical protein
VNGAEPGTLADRADPPVGRAPVEAVAVTASQDRPLVAISDGQVDRPSGPRYERHGGGLVALAHDPQRAMAALDAEVLDVGGAGLADTQPVQPEQHSKRSVVSVVVLGGEQEHTELGAIQAPASDAWTWGLRTYWAGLAWMRPSICANR